MDTGKGRKRNGGQEDRDVGETYPYLGRLSAARSASAFGGQWRAAVGADLLAERVVHPVWGSASSPCQDKHRIRSIITFRGC